MIYTFMDEFKDYTRSLSVIFMGIGFALAFVGFYFSETIFYISIGWEVATILIMIMMQESIHEWFVLKKKIKLAKREQQSFKNITGDEVH